MEPEVGSLGLLRLESRGEPGGNDGSASVVTMLSGAATAETEQSELWLADVTGDGSRDEMQSSMSG